jgi:hypothetical protein
MPHLPIPFLFLKIIKGKEYDKKAKELFNLISKAVEILFKKGTLSIDQKEHYLSSGLKIFQINNLVY